MARRGQANEVQIMSNIGTWGRLATGLVLCGWPAFCGQQALSQVPFRIQIERNVRIPLRDGVTLAADIYRPDADGRFPALVQVSYYVTGPGQAEFLAPRGYACVLANSRGRGGSAQPWYR